MMSGTVSDSQISLSSDLFGDCEPSQFRLNGQPCSETINNDDWVRIDLLQIYNVTTLALQNGHNNYPFPQMR